ncbi:PilZ domain-containing protein [Solibacillus daqui]|uniref:PilZ domain-containing protein n=1 Tax=Solibacillus daqui TaxID=2912187 RepID=UPI0023661340|nr:PilZ domain-containing protein [Solibacillus daqui]
MTFKRTEGFRFSFGEPIPAKYIILVDGKPEDQKLTKYSCEILDISPHGMKMFAFHDIGENSSELLQLEVQFILDEILIKAIGEIVWKKDFGSKIQYGLIFVGQPQVEALIISELKLRRKKEVGQR